MPFFKSLGRHGGKKYAGQKVRNADGRVYEVQPSGALVRVFPGKLKGKAAKKAAKRERMARLGRRKAA